MIGWYIGVLKAIPIFGMFVFFFTYPFKKGISLYPFYLLCVPLIHLLHVFGFWKGFLKGKETI